MSDLVGNHIVGFPTRWLKSNLVFAQSYHIESSLNSEAFRATYFTYTACLYFDDAWVQFLASFLDK